MSWSGVGASSYIFKAQCNHLVPGKVKVQHNGFWQCLLVFLAVPLSVQLFVLFEQRVVDVQLQFSLVVALE